MKRITFEIDIDLDFKFIALIPALNINLHSRQLEFEWLFLGVYAGIKSKEEEPARTYHIHIPFFKPKYEQS